LLRFLESHEITPLGEPAPVNVNVRIIAATNRDLEVLVREGRFREDLFYRLNVVRLNVPPLRERREEIPPLVHHFVGRIASEFSKGRVRVADDTMEYLVLYPWPGNVRQLQNEVRRMVALAETDDVLTPAALSAEIRPASPPVMRETPSGTEFAVPLTDKLASTLARIECEMIQAALRTHHGRVEAAAKALASRSNSPQSSSANPVVRSAATNAQDSRCLVDEQAAHVSFCSGLGSHGNRDRQK
jgi:DNA-binding NtrC family response regulator